MASENSIASSAAISSSASKSLSAGTDSFSEEQLELARQLSGFLPVFREDYVEDPLLDAYSKVLNHIGDHLSSRRLSDDELKLIFTMTELEIPSKVMDKKYIRMPKEEKVVVSDEEWDRCGKWMLHHPHMDMRFVDWAWTELQPLVDDGTLLMLKASTAQMAKEGATIFCYTRPGKREAKRAARAIRKVVKFLGILFYKVNEQTSRGVANRFGDKRVSIYMHTFLGMFYTRRNGAWMQDIEDDAENVPIASKFSKENYSGNYELPSNYKEYCYWNLPDQCEQIQCSNWYLFCSCEEEGGYLPEVDRVWLVAKQLFDEGLFVGVTLRKQADAKCAEVRLYISQHCDVYSRRTACDRIFKEASCRTVMYFTQDVKRKPKFEIDHAHEGVVRRVQINVGHRITLYSCISMGEEEFSSSCFGYFLLFFLWKNY